MQVPAVKPHGAGKSHKKGEGAPNKKAQWWEMEAKPIVKCDLAAVLASTEPPSATRAWVAIIETIASMRTNTGVRPPLSERPSMATPEHPRAPLEHPSSTLSSPLSSPGTSP